jgi:hypothetical protein
MAACGARLRANDASRRHRGVVATTCTSCNGRATDSAAEISPIDLAHTQFFQGIRHALEEFETATGEHLGSEELDRSDLPRRDELLLSTYQSLLELRKLRDLVPRRRTMEWHRLAAELFHYFQAVVHPACGTSADGPAVRFIQQALFYLDRRHQERGTIEQVLRRYRRRFPEGNDPFACPVIPPTEGSSDSDYP